MRWCVVSKELFNDLVDSLNEIKDFQDGKIDLPMTERTILRFKEPEKFDSEKIKEIRHNLHLSQSGLADLLGTSVKTVQAWEGSRENAPKGPAARLLSLLKSNPDYMNNLVIQ